MTMTDPKQDVQDVRAQFEAWAEIYTRLSFKRDSSGNYVDDQTRTAWLAYQAALQSPAVRELVEAVKAARAWHLGDKYRSGNDAEQLAWRERLSQYDTALRTLGAGHVE